MKKIKSLVLIISMFASTLASGSVSLAYFTAESVNGSVHLQWATITEFNNALFSVERSSDTEIWSVVESIPGSGNSSIAVQYETNDYNATVGNQYYRLRLMEITGLNSYSDVINVMVSPGLPASLSVYPNPGNSTVVVAASKMMSGKVCVLNAVGQVMLEDFPVNGSDFSLQIDDLPEGMYYLQFTSGDQKTLTKFYRE